RRLWLLAVVSRPLRLRANLGLLIGSPAPTRDAVPYGVFDTVTFASSGTPKMACCAAIPREPAASSARHRRANPQSALCRRVPCAARALRCRIAADRALGPPPLSRGESH